MNLNFELIFKSFLTVLLSILKSFLFLLIPVFIALIVFIIILVFYLIIYQKKYGIKPIKKVSVIVKQPNFLKKIFIMFPQRLALDYLIQDPNSFSNFGLHCIIGSQGAGKSMTVAYLLMKWKNEYPNLKIYTNMEYKHENAPLTHWKQLITNKNGKYGVVNVIDDLKAWWSNRDSKDLPAEVLAEICQQRKQKKAIVTTIQVFSEAPKAFRSQTHYVYIPKTYLGCLTVVTVSKPEYYDYEKDKFKRSSGRFFFIHTKELRDSYDTFKKIEKYKDIEFSHNSQFNEGSLGGSTGGTLGTS